MLLRGFGKIHCVWPLDSPTGGMQICPSKVLYLILPETSPSTGCPNQQSTVYFFLLRHRNGRKKNSAGQHGAVEGELGCVSGGWESASYAQTVSVFPRGSLGVSVSSSVKWAEDIYLHMAVKLHYVTLIIGIHPEDWWSTHLGVSRWVTEV